ncbi:translocation/assembly module TamB domain-containing protein [Duganella sp. FT3S]|uniref:Translocation/assembly module TamB domain-containing protein n=1 Tax=Rugamonas fusca TaxID=2758568 RepID=A0A7W2I6Z1_9BURK|nr:translocation/assembly module TamB domain-containing protein [Rugamonas fusca]MBA5605914.1 translocation/assembly module TamB domain-containing protein [Rugamonas fusca]
MSDADQQAASGGTPPSPPPRPPRRWLRRTLIGVGAVGVVLGGAVWLLGRESTLQQLMRRIAAASGGQIDVQGVSGSLYHRMHITRLVHRSPGMVITLDDLDINWSPLQFFSQGVAISELQARALTVNSSGPSTPPVLPASLAAPFRLHIADARLGQFTLLDHGSRTQLRQIRLRLTGDANGWQLDNGDAMTDIGRLQAQLAVGAQRPFAVSAKASLTQTEGAPPNPARLNMRAHGDLSLLRLDADGTAGTASGTATLALAPFDPVILHALELKASGIDPSGYRAAWPHARLAVQLAARIDGKQALAGQLALRNEGQPGPLDQQRLPLQGATAKLGGTLTAATIESIAIDLGAAGRFTGAASIARGGPQAGVDKARLALRAEHLNLQHVIGSLHATNIGGDVTVDSDSRQQTLRAALGQDGLRLDLQATLADELLQLRQARLQLRKGSVSATGQASLRDAQAFKAGISAEHFDPSAFGNYPAADINADINASGHVSPAWQVAADFTLKPGKLLGQPLSGAGKLTADAQRISGVEARLALGQNTAEVRGGLGTPDQQLDWKIAARDLNTAGGKLLGALAASGTARGTLAAPRTSFDATLRGLGLAAARHPVPDSVLHASGEVWLAGATHQVEMKVAGNAQRINPAAFGAYPIGAVNAEFNGDATLGADWRTALNARLQPSTLSGSALSGYAKLAADPRHIGNADINLQLGPNSLQAQGAFGSPRDRLDWKIDAPQLASAGPPFGGTLRAAGTLSGSAERPALTLNVEGANLRAPGQQQIKSLRGSASLGAIPAASAGAGAGTAAGTITPSAANKADNPVTRMLAGVRALAGARANDAGDDPVVADLAITGYDSPALTLDRARLQASGTRAAHVLQLSGGNRDFDAAVRLKGGWRGDAWTGAIDTLQNRGRYALTLQAPAPLRLAAPSGSGVAGLLHPEQFALGATTIALPAGSIRIDSVEKTGPQWRSKGQAAGVPVNYLAQLSDAWRDNIKSDMTVGAAWSLAVQAALPGGAPAVDGMLHLYREQGDLTVTGADVPLPLGLKQLDARVDAANGALRLQLALDGSRAGQARFDASAQLIDGKLADASALTVNGSANMGSLAWLAPLAGQPGLELDGTLKLVMSGAGTWGAPQLNGDITGDKLVLNWAEQGIRLRNGQLQARLTGDQLLLQKLAFDGAEGHALAEGAIRFANAQASMQLKLTADQLEVLARPDRTLVISGQSTLVRDSQRFQLDGKFRADRANIELASQDTPTMSSDVVILGRGAAPVRDSKSLPLSVDVEADLGDAFTLKGKGLDAQLAGAVRIRVADRRPPRVTGSIRVASGTYAAYGQKLAIEKGVINFTGAYDNPGLNILAVRKRPEGEALNENNVEAGVEVRGTALAPVAKLVSTPAVSDSDKLAWLVLGHGIDSTAGNDMALLSTAAGALFGGGQGRLANTLGLDELGVSQAKGLETTVVTVGKRLSSRAYLSFEQGASSATSLVKLRYKLNPRITLQFQTGTNNALDVLYTWAFD